MNPELDQDVINLAKAIRQTESGGNFNAKGKSGEHGAYQFTPDTWNRTAPKYGISVPIEQATPEQQNAVAYNKIKEWKDIGRDVTQIASMWNAGESEPDAYTGRFSNGKPSSSKALGGTPNSYGVDYDVPKYAESVAKAYLTVKNGGEPTIDYGNPSSTTVPQETTQAPEEEKKGLVSKLIGRGKNIGQEAQNKNPLMAGVHVAGQLAGGVNDITGAAVGALVDKTPVVGPALKKAGEVVGQSVEGLAQTETGKKVIQKGQELAQKYPETAKTAGDIANIAGALPVFAGVGAVKSGAGKLAGKALEGVATKQATRELESVVGKTISGRKALSAAEKRGYKPLEILANMGIPVEDGRYIADEGLFNRISSAISEIEDNELQAALSKASGQSVATRQPLENVRNQVLEDVRREFKATGQVSKAEAEVNRVFDDLKNSYGDYLTLQDQTDIKRGVRNTVNFNSPKLESDVTYHIGQTLQKNIEDQAAKLGLGDINAINAKMGELIEAQKILKLLDNKRAESGSIGKAVHGALTTAATIGGEAIGNSIGIPFAGGMLARGGGNAIGKAFEKKTSGGLLRKLIKPKI